MIVAWKAATGALKDVLLSQIFRLKSGLIRQLVMKAARQEKTAADTEDLFQAGCIGFQRALEGFDPSLGYSISTYAWWKIKHEVQRLARASTTVTLPRIRLTNEERARAVLALRENPDVAPESIGIRRNHLDQVRDSIGVRYLSDALDRGARAIERKFLDAAGEFDPEETLDEARRYRSLDGIIARVRAGGSAAEMGLSPDAYAAALEIIRLEEPMSEAENVVEMQPRKKPGPKPGSRRGPARTPRAAATPRDRLKARLAELDAERKLLEMMLAAPEDAVARVVASFAA